tara:strand:+ start:261 stop:530 length:270 start_codon:yes stop_codon:yes gene_type:complete
MANIRVKTNNNTTTVRVGQTNAIKVVASNQSAAVGTVDNLVNVGDVVSTGRAANTFLMYDGSQYIHVPAHQVVDLSDGSDDEAYDAGTF